MAMLEHRQRGATTPRRKRTRPSVRQNGFSDASRRLPDVLHRAARRALPKEPICTHQIDSYLPRTALDARTWTTSRIDGGSPGRRSKPRTQLGAPCQMTSSFATRRTSRSARRSLPPSSRREGPWNRDWQVRPVARDERFPDAVLRCEDDVRPFEVFEADMENRRRCDEYRAGKGKPDQFEH